MLRYAKVPNLASIKPKWAVLTFFGFFQLQENPNFESRILGGESSRNRHLVDPVEDFTQFWLKLRFLENC